MLRIRRSLSLSLFVVALLALGVSLSVAQEATPEAEEATTPGALMEVTNEYTMATVVKLTGIAWFDRMEEGVTWFGEDYPSVTAFQQGPAQADAALQVQVIEDLVAQGVDSICVIPFQPETVEPVLERALAEGIVVVAHEASNQQNINFDIEAFDNSAYGRHLMDHLAERMGGEGEYAVFVGSLTSRTHNEWVDAAIAHQLENYPNMTLVGDKNESFDDPQVAYERMQELLIAYPNLKGVQGSASTDVAGVGQAVEEAGLQDQIAVVGTSLPSIAGDLIETGAVDLISFWDPALAGYACNQIALMQLEGTLPPELAEGELPADGFGFANLPGYESLTLDGKVFYGSAWVDVTIDNVGDWDF
jgi:simple sugar transport system substrate-binding protein